MKMIWTKVKLPAFAKEQVCRGWKKRQETNESLELWEVWWPIFQKGLEFFDPETGYMRQAKPGKPYFPRFDGEADFDEFGNGSKLIQAMDASSLMLWLAAPNNACIHANARLLAYTGRTLDDFLHMAWAELIHPDDRRRVYREARLGFRRRHPFDLVYRLRRKDGRYGWLFDHAEPRSLPNGICAGFLGVLSHVTVEGDDEDFPEESIIPDPDALQILSLPTSVSKTDFVKGMAFAVAHHGVLHKRH